jgi:hypothetical protein
MQFARSRRPDGRALALHSNSCGDSQSTLANRVGSQSRDTLNDAYSGSAATQSGQLSQGDGCDDCVLEQSELVTTDLQPQRASSPSECGSLGLFQITFLQHMQAISSVQ